MHVVLDMMTGFIRAYVGDLEDLRTVKALQETITRLTALLEVEPELVVADLHPKYNSTMVAREMELPMIQVQHHYAHVLFLYGGK